MAKTSKYHRQIGSNEDGMSDVYDILLAYHIVNPALQHAIKKLLCAGQRSGGKSWTQDIDEAVWSLNRALELYEDDDAENHTIELPEYPKNIFVSPRAEKLRQAEPQPVYDESGASAGAGPSEGAAMVKALLGTAAPELSSFIDHLTGQRQEAPAAPAAKLTEDQNNLIRKLVQEQVDKLDIVSRTYERLILELANSTVDPVKALVGVGFTIEEDRSGFTFEESSNMNGHDLNLKINIQDHLGLLENNGD